jgi:O-antigen ligase
MPAISVGFTVIIAFFIFMAFKGNYLNYAPNYQTTIYHSELNEHLQATFEGQDLSSEERIYRWIAGIRMWLQKPVTGYVPGNFVNFYRDYTVSSFRTYVSENPENSSIHNYFLLMLTEQGIVGLIIFLTLTFFIFYYAQKIYNETESIQGKQYVIAITLSLTIIYVNTFLSDLIETDKVGTFFFMNIALLVGQDLLNKRRKQSSAENAL